MSASLRNDIETLKPLVIRTAELADRPEEETKKRLWAEHNALKRTPRAPVCLFYEGIPSAQWSSILGDGFMRCADPVAKTIEYDLRRRVWMAENVPDDHIVWKPVVIPAVCVARQEWGVKLDWKHSDSALGAGGYDPPMSEGIDVSRLTVPRHEFDDAATASALDKARELTGGMLDVFPLYRGMSAPFDVATKMRGMEGLMFDVALEPEKVTALMEFITSAMQEHEERREREGHINFPHQKGSPYVQCGFRVNCSYAAPDIATRKLGLRDEWTYLSQQTSSGLGPAQYAAFVQPYNVRLASYFTNSTVYYHGCECLDQKMEILAALPNLRRFHVSPWTSLEKAVDIFRDKAVLEVHDHPGKVFFGSSEETIRQGLRRLFDVGRGCAMDVNLSDIHSFNGNPRLLAQWAAIAQEEAACAQNAGLAQSAVDGHSRRAPSC